MTSKCSVVLADPVRTAIGAFGGSLKDIPAPDLGAIAIGAAIVRAGIRPDEIESACSSFRFARPGGCDRRIRL